MPAPLRVIFMGTPAYACPTLEALWASPHDVVAVYTQPPRPAGRGHHLQLSPVHALAQEKGIPVFMPSRLSSPEDQQAFHALNADVAVVVAYGLLLPLPILEAPRLGCYNGHASLLPRWRGASPLQRALQHGDALSGVTIMKMDRGLDTGPMALTQTLPLEPTLTTPQLHDALSQMTATLMLEALDALQAGTLSVTSQPSQGVTIAPKLRKEEGLLDWRKPAEVLEREVRAFQPWPGSQGRVGDLTFKVLQAQVVSSTAGAAPGTVMTDGFLIACGQDALQIQRLQIPGKAAMDVQAFLRGHTIKAGQRCDLLAEDNS
jgi:methionyl-tRNA formyltransferase